MSALDDLKEISLNKISPLEASVIYLSRDYESDAALAAAELAALTQRLEAAEAERDALKEERNKIAKHIRVTLDDGTAPDNLVDHVLFVMIHEYDPMVKRIQRLENELAEARNKV